MASVSLFVILVVGVGVAMGTSLRRDSYADLETQPDGTGIQLDDVARLVSEFLALSEDDYTLVADKVIQAVQLTRLGKLCNGDTCKICLGRLPFIGAVCLEVEYVKSPASLHLILTKNGHEIICITFHNELPKICLFHHLCAQIVDINITNGKICASLALKGHKSRNLIKNKCIDI